MKRALFVLLEALGAVRAARFLHKNALTIVLYHGVAPRENLGIYNYRRKFIEPRDFEHQMRYFSGQYAFVGLDEGLAMLRSGTLPSYALAVTFDDGYRNFHTHAYPILKKMGIPATMFVTTDFVCDKKPLWVDRLEYAMGKGQGSYAEKTRRDAKIRDELKKLGENEREVRLLAVEASTGAKFADFEGERAVYAPLSESEIKEMQRSGTSFGVHTKSHPILSRLPPNRIEEEIAGSKAALERICGNISSTFAYPNGQRGDWNESVERSVGSNGFSAALTTVEGFNTPDTHQMRLRRMTLDGTDSGPAFAAIASGMRIWLNAIRHHAN